MISLALWSVLVVSVLTHARPNFVFLLTDDQDLLLNSLNFMPRTTRLVGGQGRTFTNFYVNSPICCPSRSSILTGQFPHNIKVYNNSISGGCSSPWWQQHVEPYTIASILKSDKNYTTFYAGKYLNQYGGNENGGVGHVPVGYDWWLGLQGNSKYYNYTLSINGTGHYFTNDYLTDKITDYALEFLDENVGDFFMILAPPACHASFTPAPRHKNLFPNLQTVKSVPFNTTPIDKHWLVEMPPTHLPTDVTVLNDIYRNRIRTLQSVDDLVERISAKLDSIGVANDTYFIVASDNGFHIGQFAQAWDKRQPYESDIHVPFMIKGPRIEPKTLTQFPASTIDIMPTILDLAGVDLSRFNHINGRSFKKYLFEDEDEFDEDILVEYWGESDDRSVDPKCGFGPHSDLSECTTDAWCKCQDARNNTYRCVLNVKNDEKFKLCVFGTGFIESYDLVKDPHELVNIKAGNALWEKFHNIFKDSKNRVG